jgi:hypothetical protein
MVGAHGRRRQGRSCGAVSVAGRSLCMEPDSAGVAAALLGLQERGRGRSGVRGRLLLVRGGRLRGWSETPGLLLERRSHFRRVQVGVCSDTGPCRRRRADIRADNFRPPVARNRCTDPARNRVRRRPTWAGRAPLVARSSCPTGCSAPPVRSGFGYAWPPIRGDLFDRVVMLELLVLRGPDARSRRLCVSSSMTMATRRA